LNKGSIFAVFVVLIKYFREDYIFIFCIRYWHFTATHKVGNERSSNYLRQFGSLLPLVLCYKHISHMIFVFSYYVSLRFTFRYDFCIQKMFGSSLSPVVHRELMPYLNHLCLCVQWCPTHSMLCFCFVCLPLVSYVPKCCQYLWIFHFWLHFGIL
jgi:hypothetical protein